jgi:hypothetical protein
MNTYENSFTHGRDLMKKFLIGAVISCVLSLVFAAVGSPLQSIFFILTVVIFFSTIYVTYKYCCCPHCGKHIMLGVLKITTCPRCHHNLITGKKAKKSQYKY